MTDLPLLWLRQTNVAVAARNLYPAEHPRVVRAVSGLEALTERLTRDRPEVSLFVIEGRLACDGELVPGSDALATRAFDVLHTYGLDRITLRRGATPRELEWLVSVLAGKSGLPPGSVLHPTTHLRFSTFDDQAAAPRARTRQVATAAQTLAATMQALPAVWQGVGSGGTLDFGALESALLPLVRIVESTSGDVLPLEALRSHDDYTATHVTNVAVLSMALAQAMHWSAADIRQVGVAALLHDIGKMHVPADVLNAKGRLSPSQLALIRQHPEMGARMLLETSGAPRLAAIVAYEHHLHNDGGGYPSVPSGWRIHPASAMTHVADVYDALRSNRPYRAGLDHEVIMEMMAKDRGPVFPPDVLDVFFEDVIPRAVVSPLPADESGTDSAPGDAPAQTNALPPAASSAA